MAAHRSLVGKKYGKLLVLEKTGRVIRGIRKPRPLILYKVRCDCGKEKEVTGQDLAWSRTTSCGCSRRDEWDSAHRAVLYSYIDRAKRHRFLFEFTEDEFYSLIKKECHYCKRTPSNKSKDKYNGAVLYYNGLDRIDNLLGYTKVNCVPCCDICNKAKRALSYNDFKNWIKDLVEANK